MQAELEKTEHQETSPDTADKQPANHLIGELHVQNEHEIHSRRDNAQNYVLKHLLLH
jgi:hypothetical protein